MRIGPTQLLLIVGIGFFLMYVMGPKNLPKMGKMFGQTMGEIRKGMVEFTEEMNAVGDAGEVQSGQAVVEQASVVTAEPTIEELEALLEAKRAETEAAAQEPVIDPDRKVARIIYEDEV